MVNGTLAVCPVATVTGREAPPLTEQLDWIPLRVTVWLPVTRFWTVTESPLGALGPEVAVLTVRLPVSAVQLTVNAAVVAPPAGTVTVFEAPPLTVQFAGTSVRATVWSPAGSPL